MDQAIAFGGGVVKDAEVRAMLGTIANEQIFRLLDALADLDAQQVVNAIHELAERVPDFASVMQDLLSLLHRVALFQAVPDAVEASDSDFEQIQTLAGKISREDVQLFYQIGLLGQRDLPLAPDPRSGFEMTLLRMLAFRPQQAGNQPEVSSGKKPVITAAKPVPQAAATANQVQEAAVTSKPDIAPESIQTGTEQDLANWDQVVARLKLGGIARQLAENCQYRAVDGSAITLTLDPAHEHMLVESSEKNLHRALEEFLRKQIKLQIKVEQPESETPAQKQARAKAERQREAEQAMSDDPIVKAAEEQFGARLIKESVKPID
jgi:DNA polymerase-3 subunit gamma/tau